MRMATKIFSVFLIGACVCTQYAFAENCANATFREANPEQCKKFDFFGTKSLAIGGGLLAVGGLATGIAFSGGGNSHSSAPAPAMPTIRTYYIGTDIDSATLASIQSMGVYARNINQYNDIHLAYSLARGYTGKDSVISVLDAGDNSWHGNTVANIARGPIAPDATVNTYQIFTTVSQIKPYDEVANIISSASDTNIFNSSWNISNITANNIATRAQIENLTSSEFILSIETAAAQHDAIFVFAAGNQGQSQSGAISALPRVVPETMGHFVNVVAYDSETQSLADFSNACGITRDWCITAPGSDIRVGAIPANGTSFAAPIVSAAISVIREAFPYLASSEITEILFTTARDLGESGVDDIYGHGMLDLEAATRPIGAPTVMISENVSVPLRVAHIPATMAHSIKQTGVQLAYFDEFGRAFNTNLDEHIKTFNPGRGFIALREQGNHSATFGNLEIGFNHGDFLTAHGFISTTGENTVFYTAINNSVDIADTQIFSRAQIGVAHPNTGPDSIISAFSNIYTSTLTLGVTRGDWKIAISAPDTILGGNMYIRTATARAASGEILFTDYTIPMETKPALEYSVGYKFLTTAFVDNPYGTDEFYIMAKSHLTF